MMYTTLDPFTETLPLEPGLVTSSTLLLERLEEMVLRQAALKPDAVAILHQGSSWTYRELEARSLSIAHRLRALGAKPGTLVGIAMNRSFDLIAAVLGVLKSGAGYVPLDPSYPAERLNFVLNDCAAAILIVDGALPTDVVYDGEIVDVFDTIPRPEDTTVEWNEWAERSPEDPAYVIYTSGSTGEPKGVVLSHTASIYVNWARDLFRAGELDCVAFVTSICFDPSIFEIFAPLAAGGSVLVKDNALDPFSEYEQPTLIQGVPSVFSELVKIKAIPNSVRVLNLGGEVLTRRLVDEIYASTAVESIFNHYGPTEATTCASVALVSRRGEDEPSLGYGICGASLALLDEDLCPVAQGETGEIVISGPTVARGYLGRPELTARQFIADPFGAPGARRYRTGDLARMRADGTLEFVERIGDQIKFNGIRVELGEIEKAVERLSDVRRAAVAVRRDSGGRSRLVAYYQGDVNPDPAAFRRMLGTWLPASIVPTDWVRVTDFPMGLTGKLDRKALPDIVETRRPFADAGGQDIELVIRDICADALNLPDFGVDDDFFECGGDSLAAIRLSLILEERLGLTIAPVVLSHATTPRSIALAMRSRRSEGDGHIVTIVDEGDRPPLFGVPELYGWPTCFVTLARQPALECPVYGLVPGAMRARMLESPDLGELVRSYADSIEAQLVDRRCAIAGYSFGGIWAHALACELRERGVDATLVLIDSPLNADIRIATGVERGVLSRLTTNDQRSHPVRRALLALAGRAYGNILWRQSIAWLRMAPWQGHSKHQRQIRYVPSWVPEDDVPIATAFIKAAARFRPKSFDGPCVMIAATQDETRKFIFDHDGQLGWRSLLTGPVRRIDSGVNHAQIIRMPYVAKLAEILDNELL